MSRQKGDTNIEVMFYSGKTKSRPAVSIFLSFEATLKFSQESLCISGAPKVMAVLGC